MRVLHISDIHVQQPLHQLSPRELLNKRFIGIANLVVAGRRRRFERVHEKLLALDVLRREARIDLVICSGDLTALGTEREVAEASALMAPLADAPLGLVCIPGNHDVYSHDSVRSDRFMRHFGRFRSPAAAAGWPYVQMFGEELVVVAVDSARPNPTPWKSSGRVPEAQLAALERITADAALLKRFMLVVMHYGPFRASGARDHWYHGLENADRVVAACAARPSLALLHGHIHERFILPARPGRPWIACAGSATDAGREGAWIFELGARPTAAAVSWVHSRYEVSSNVVHLTNAAPV